MNRICLVFALVAVSAVHSVASAFADPSANLIACCRAENDLYQVLRANGIAVARANSPKDAVATAPTGGGVLVLADGDAPAPQALSAEIFARAAEKRLRLYVELPAALPGLEIGKPRAMVYERLVVASDFFGQDLRRLRILGVNGMSFLPVKAAKSHLVAAQVAGVDRAVYGLPEETFPILFEHPQGKVLVATAGLSHFVTARYAPADAWRSVWAGVLHWLVPGQKFSELKWTPAVRPTYGPDEALPADVEQTRSPPRAGLVSSLQAHAAAVADCRNR